MAFRSALRTSMIRPAPRRGPHQACQGSRAGKGCGGRSQLKDAGAVIIGKTNMHELGMGTTALVSYYGPVHGPWNANYIAGGSSGGSAAAVASGMCYATLDT